MREEAIDVGEVRVVRRKRGAAWVREEEGWRRN